MPDAAGTRIHPPDGLLYQWIPAGRFVMGCAPEDRFCGIWRPPLTPDCRLEIEPHPLTEKNFSDELPPHPVTISKGFWISHRPVTVADYERLMGVKPRQTSGSASMPVTCVTWFEAKAYCEAAGGRLPTEAEWEYARRLDGMPACLVGLSLAEATVQAKHHLFEAAFNRNEWVADWYGPYTPEDVTDPQGQETGTRRVIRGHSWGFDVDWLDRPTSRARLSPDSWQGGLGFRCVLR